MQGQTLPLDSGLYATLKLIWKVAGSKGKGTKGDQKGQRKKGKSREGGWPGQSGKLLGLEGKEPKGIKKAREEKEFKGRVRPSNFTD